MNLRSGRPTQLPPPIEGYESGLPPPARALLADVLTCSAVGSPETVRSALAAFIEKTRADELMITAQIFDHSARLRSYEIVADIHKSLQCTAGAEAAAPPGGVGRHQEGDRGRFNLPSPENARMRASSASRPARNSASRGARPAA